MSDLRVSQADVFLLEQWQEDSTLSNDAQREQIFTKWMELGFHAREPYRIQQARIGGASSLSLPQHSQELLNRVRLPAERSIPETLWLRTCYEPSTEDSWTEIQKYLAHKFWDEPPIFNDPSLYNYGSNWEKVFLRAPQLLYNDQLNEEFDEYVDEALQEGIESESCDAQHAEENGYDPVEDELPWTCFYSEYLWRLIAGRIHVIDKKTLAKKGRNAGKVLVIWFDHCGRAIRYSRQELDAAGSIAGGMDYYLKDHGCWTNADIGESYEWGAPLGPPYWKGGDDDEETE
ncbi:hypothetical protein N7540_000096 [Penicillium herquei]|nr:hypothetical protein N7540_000096 [Penicillium herquei]